MPNDFANPYTYTGRRLDPETGLYYYRNRYYHAQLGRFVSRDPIGYEGGWNVYQYVLSNPTNATDPSGFAERIYTPNSGYHTSPYLDIIANPYLTPEQKDQALQDLRERERLYAEISASFMPGPGMLRSGPSLFGRLFGRFWPRFFGRAPRGSLHAPGDVPDGYTVVKGGTKPPPPPGTRFSGSQGVDLPDASRGVPHGQVQPNTAGQIRSQGGTIEVVPEPTRSGNINYQHVDIVEGGNATTFGPPCPNPVPNSGRIK